MVLKVKLKLFLLELQVKNNVEVLSKLENGTIVAVKQNKILGTSFHPEISGSSKVHEYFLNLTSS
jgi:5'-phosphate synthase pdxT subunit